MLKVVMAARGCDRADAIKVVAEATGRKIQFERPWKEGDSVYKYRDVNMKVLKEVRRFISPTGSKTFQQRRPIPGGYRYDVQGVGACLYNAHRLFAADTVAIVEGEKDSNTVTELALLCAGGGELLEITSGGSDTWHPSLATQLKGKRVIVMPDANPAGEEYARDVIASLKAAGIECAVVSFAGTGHKDITDFLKVHGKQALVQHVRQTTDWVIDPTADEDEVIEI